MGKRKGRVKGHASRTHGQRQQWERRTMWAGRVVEGK